MFLTVKRKSDFWESELLSTFWLQQKLCDQTIFLPLFVLCRGRHQLFPSDSIRVWIWFINWVARDFLLSSLISTTLQTNLARSEKSRIANFSLREFEVLLSCSSLIPINSLWSLSRSKWVRDRLQSFWKQLVRFPNQSCRMYQYNWVF